jgi:hypothetical protein
LHTGSEQGFPALDDATVGEMVAAAEAHGDEVSRHGTDWLIEIAAD